MSIDKKGIQAAYSATDEEMKKTQELFFGLGKIYGLLSLPTPFKLLVEALKEEDRGYVKGLRDKLDEVLAAKDAP